VRYRFVREHAQQFPLAALCRIMEVAKSGYYVWRGRGESTREAANRVLLVQIKAAHRRSRKRYGRRRIHAQLRRESIVCSRNLLARDFSTAAPDRVWVSDITYLACEQGWEYLATVMDLHSRRIVGWAMQSSLERSLTLRALEMAITQRRPGPGLIHHSDRGSQYACADYQHLLAGHGLIPSMSRKGDVWDNAPKESFFGTLKSELGWHGFRPPRDQIRREVFEYIEVFYNRQRLHSSLGYQTPVAFETAAQTGAP
jgi:putative transposase